jgi:hypothetical protein
MNLKKKILQYFAKKKEKVNEYFTFAGHSFKVLDPVSMPNIRQTAIFVSDYEREWGMNKADFLTYDKIMLSRSEFPSNWIDDQDLVYQLETKLREVTNLIETRMFLIQEDFQYKPMLKNACHIILIDDEKADVIDNATYSKKLELCQKHPEIELFFLRISMNFMLTLNGTANTSEMWEFYPSKAVKLTESKVYKEINLTIY